MKPRTILVIEDEEDTVLFLRDRLELAGYRVVSASDGQDGYEKALAVFPDLILLDVQIPRMNGYQVCHKLREDPSMKDVPIFLVTARAQKHDRTMGMECGATDYVSKPFDTEDLLVRIVKSLENRA